MLFVSIFPVVALYLLLSTLLFKISLVIFGLTLLIAVIFADKLILEFLNARELSENENEQLYNITRRTSYILKMSTPKLYSYDGLITNCLISGLSKDRGSIIIDSKLSDLLTEKELEVVLIHRIVSLAHRDVGLLTFVTLLSLIARSLVSLVKKFFRKTLHFSAEQADAIALVFLMFVYPTVDLCVWFAKSPKKIFTADLKTYQVTNDLISLKSAMYKILHTGKGDNFRSRVWALLYFVDNVNSEHFFNIFDDTPTVDSRLEFLENSF